MISENTLLLFAYNEISGEPESLSIQNEIACNPQLSSAFDDLSCDLSVIGEASPPDRLIRFIMQYEAATECLIIPGNSPIFVGLN